LKKLAAVLALVMASFVVAPGLLAPAQAADDYTAGVRTSCHIDVPAIVRVNHSPRVTITVRPNAPAGAASTRAVRRAAQPTGTVELSIIKGGTSIFSRTVDYNGRPVTIQGPVIRQPGHYVVRARFRTADGTEFKSCHNNDAFDVRAGQGPNDDGPGPNPGNQNPDGLLPDTGGPDLFWLLLGLALVGSGGGLVLAAKRRTPSPLYEIGG
jgi:LPXTG-motif cell wall-anchored protein